MKNTRDAIPPFGAAHGYAAGDNVEICDGSEAHGDKGKVLWVQDDGLIIVELEAGCVWPVTEHELKPHNIPHQLPPPMTPKTTTDSPGG